MLVQIRFFSCFNIFVYLTTSLSTRLSIHGICCQSNHFSITKHWYPTGGFSAGMDHASVLCSFVILQSFFNRPSQEMCDNIYIHLDSQLNFHDSKYLFLWWCSFSRLNTYNYYLSALFKIPVKNFLVPLGLGNVIFSDSSVGGPSSYQLVFSTFFPCSDFYS